MKKNWYKSKVFVITGASGDIGSAVCRKFAPLGLRMYLLDLLNPKIDPLKQELKDLGAELVEFYEMDVTNQDQIANTFKKIGQKEQYIDILFNNAGIGSKCSITNNGSFDEYRKVMAINTDGMWLVLQAALPFLGRPIKARKTVNKKGGQLIFTSSAAGRTGVPNMAAYAMSKSAIIAMADSLRLEYKMMKEMIKVITIISAPAKTGFYNTPETIEWIENYEKRGFLFKLLEADDIAKRVFHASRKNKKEIYVPRWWKLIDILFVFSHNLIGNLLIKIEKTNRD
ncbi:MAG: SDR family oxidoreductase [Candidatus Lokiarchaeota archaeon]|nr:SDR family oxidoreductase [Candidatus Lokiarchaeota archaeon]